MKIRKTPLRKRSVYTYTYYDSKGEKTTITLHPGENGVTEMDIKMLHDFDDREVYRNVKNSKPPMMPWDIEWNETHPNEERQKNYNLSLDAFFNDEYGEDYSDRILDLAAPEEDAQLQMVRDIVSSFPEEQQLLYRHLYIEGYTTNEVAAMYNVSAAAISKRSRHLKEKIIKNLKNF